MTATWRRRGLALAGGVAVAALAAASAAPARAATSVPTPVPTVTKVTPGSGPPTGGNTVDVQGTGFLFSGTTPPSVNFNYASGTNVHVISDEELTVTAPANPAGMVHVTVSNTVGTSQPTLLDEYTYAVAVSGVSPNAGGVNGHTTVTISGTGFTGASAVQFDGVNALGYTVLNDAQISAVTPPHAADTAVNVSVTAAGVTVSCSACFTYQQGFWTVNGTGQVVPAGAAQNFGNAPAGLNAPVVSMAAPPSGLGYWLLARDGGTFAENVPFMYGGNRYKTCTCFVGIAADYTGGGYWEIDNFGEVYSFGDAQYEGNVSDPCNCVVGIAADPHGMGYWVVLRNGSVYSKGSAQYHGNALGISPRPIVGITAAPSGAGYWLTNDNGQIYSEGVPYDGGVGQSCQCIVGMASTPDAGGYWVALSPGSVEGLGDAHAVGSGAPGSVAVAELP